MQPLLLRIQRITSILIGKRALAGLALLYISAFLLCACRQNNKFAYAPEYSPTPVSAQRILLFGVYPFHNPHRVHEDFQPIVDDLNRKKRDVAIRLIRLEASRSYDEFDKKLQERHFHLALANPYQTVNAMKYGYRVFGKMGDDNIHHGIILVRKDSRIEKLTDLKGKTISFPAPTAFAATMMPLYYLHTHGVNINRDIFRLYSGSQESSIMNVYLGKSAAGATWPPHWEAFRQRNPKAADELMVKWETPPLVNNGLIVRDDVPKEIAEEIASHLISLHAHEEGRRMLSALPLSRFEPASDSTYKPVAEFMKRYKEINQP